MLRARRALGYLLTGLAAAISCAPLRDLDLYSRGETSSGGSEATGGASSGGLGGISAGGLGGTLSVPACGNGVLEDGEDCDDAGASTSCTQNCTERACPSGCECFISFARTYALCFEPKTAADARSTCAAEGLTLAFPESGEENAFLRAIASRRALAEVWLGGSDETEEGQWVDDQGRLFWTGGPLGEAPDGAYENFRAGEPNNAGAWMNQDCLSLWDASDWDDRECDDELSFFCEETSPGKPDCGNGLLDEGEACDPGEASTASCDADCSLPRCGDGLWNEAAGEQCDDGNEEPLDSCRDCASTGLVAHYPLTERMGPLAFDDSGLGRSGTLEGGAGFTPSGIGIYLDGSTSYIRVPKKSAPILDGVVTYMALIRSNRIFDGTRDLISQNVVGQENWLRINNGWLEVGTWNAPDHDNGTMDANLVWPFVEFHHVAARYDGKRWALFVDGEQKVNAAGVAGALPLEAELLIGGRPDGDRFFSGIMRDVRIYERSVSSADILAIAQAQLSAASSLALGGTATQVSTNNGRTADKAIDGNVNGDSPAPANSVTHTEYELAPWWQVQLKQPACVSEIHLFNRTDSYTERLANGKIETSVDGTNYETVATFGDPVGVWAGFTFSARDVSYVRVSLNDESVGKILSLAEVQVFGTSGLCP